MSRDLVSHEEGTRPHRSSHTPPASSTGQTVFTACVPSYRRHFFHIFEILTQGFVRGEGDGGIKRTKIFKFWKGLLKQK